MSTAMFQGKDGKNSSKVLAPPGGKCNNIFGFADNPEPVQPQRRRQPAPSQSSPTQHNREACDQSPTRSYKPVTSFNPVTGQPISSPQLKAQPPQQQAASPQQQPSPPKQQTHSDDAAHTSIKIRNPPGGKSSIFF